jgi:hypothetical protein
MSKQLRRNHWVGPLEGKDVEIAASVDLTGRLISAVATWQKERPKSEIWSDAVLTVGLVNFIRVAGERLYGMQEQLPEADRPTRAQFMFFLGELIANQFEDLADGMLVEEQVAPGEES